MKRMITFCLFAGFFYVSRLKVLSLLILVAFKINSRWF